jgi:enterochelin esterase-like enzyme
MRLSILLAIAIAVLDGQDVKPPTITSPDVSADGRVVFRLWAPKASGVQLSGDWMGPQQPVALTKSDDGVWSASVGPLEPNVYTYGFLVDGVRASDPSCRCTFSWAGRAASSRFTIRGSAPEPWEPRATVKGTLHYETYFSQRQQRTRGFIVYTPSQYQTARSQPFPVLLLLPGTPGDETDWTTGGGFADVIFDNLIAEGKMRPMVVVMHAADVLANGRRAANLVEFEPIIVNELVPEVKKRYRVENKPDSWAIAGLSLGGEFAMTVGLRHPELFRSVVSMSGSMVERDFEDRFGKALAQPAEIKKNYRLIWLGCGSGDIFAGGNKALAGKLTETGIPLSYREVPGLHVMPVFRRQLTELLPKLFR